MSSRTAVALLIATVLALLAVHALTGKATEPFFNNDETRHVMTGVFFRDFLVDMPLKSPRDYIIRYYLQYPALGFPLWPPLFHVTEGVLMLGLGTSMAVAKGTILIHAALACMFLFLLVRRTHGPQVAVLAAALLGFAPLFFVLSRQVMLDVPTITWILGATFFFVRFLDSKRTSDVLLAGLFSAFAALTRFNAIFLLPVFVVLGLQPGRRWVFRRADTYAAAALVFLLVTPFYALTASQIGWVYGKLAAAKGGASPLTLESLWFYPSLIPRQIGWVLLVPCLVGLVRALSPSQRTRALPYLAITALTYLMLTPVGIRDSRYALSWIPAFAVFGAEGAHALCERLRRPGLFPALGILLVAGTAAQSLAAPAPYVRGYEAAARYVLTRTRTAWCCLFDGGLNGNFIYQVRRNDPDRRLWVLRGDKLLYSVLLNSEPGQPSIEKSDTEMLAAIFKYDPEFLVVESPMTFGNIPAADRFRTLLDAHPERFKLEATLPVDSNERGFKGVKLKLYRNIMRNPNPSTELEIEMLTLRRSIRTVAPRGGADSSGHPVPTRM